MIKTQNVFLNFFMLWMPKRNLRNILYYLERYFSEVFFTLWMSKRRLRNIFVLSKSKNTNCTFCQLVYVMNVKRRLRNILYYLEKYFSEVFFTLWMSKRRLRNIFVLSKSKNTKCTFCQLVYVMDA